MKNWKTTLGGILGALSVPLMASTDPRVHFAGMGLAIVAATWFGYHAQDKGA
jgi:hypothetical protein